jgi:energy-coupling factor transporter ATP-binding protein EcfA2
MTQTNPAWHATVDEGFRGGHAENLSIYVDTMQLGGSTVKLPPAGVTAIVGGNNVGKSTVLRDLVALMHREPGVEPAGWRLVDEVTLHKSGEPADLLAWMDEHATFVAQPEPSGFVRMHHQQPISANSLISYWTQSGPTRLGPVISPFLVHFADALSRAAMVQGTGQRRNIEDPPSHPLHHLQDDPKLARDFSDVSERIFRRPLTLDRLSGNTYLRVGATTVEAPPIDAVAADYREALVGLPLLEQQGDGMKSLLGLLLPVMTAVFPVVVIDEPEAFLHPPQALELGRALATLARDRGIQVILATHDRNLITGLLDADAPVSVLRLDRQDDRTTAWQLAPEDIRELWTDPVMRYSNVLDGLFHRVVVVAEADPDCRFYAAALDSANDASPLAIPPSEIQFVPANGKDGMPKIVKALLAVHVRVVASPDLDLLDDAGKIRKLVEVFDGDWQSVEGHYQTCTAGFRVEDAEATCGDVLNAVSAALKPVSTEPWTSEVREKLMPSLRTSRSKWKELKRFGTAAFSGEGAVRAQELLDALETMGICCVRAGELERMAPTLGVRKGASWLPAALEAGAHTDLPAQQHVQRLTAAAGSLRTA